MGYINVLACWICENKRVLECDSLFFFFWVNWNRDGNGEGRDRRMGFSLPPHMNFSCPIPAPPRMTGKISCPSPPLKAPQSPTPPIYFLLIFPTTITIFSNKMTCFNNKKILEPNKCSKLLSSVHYYFFLLRR